MGEGGSGHKGPHVLCSLDFLLESVGEGGGSDIMGFLFWEDDFGFLCGKGGRQGREGGRAGSTKSYHIARKQWN